MYLLRSTTEPRIQLQSELNNAQNYELLVIFELFVNTKEYKLRFINVLHDLLSLTRDLFEGDDAG